jgi:hypothetical protein
VTHDAPGARSPGKSLRIATLLLLGCAATAWADGAHIALRATSGAYSITLFTAPDPLVSGPVDLSLLVADASSGEALGDATATGSLTLSGSPGARFTLTHAAASNKLLLAAEPVLADPGAYTLVLHIERPGSPTASFTTVLPVAEEHRRRTTLLFALVLPLAVIALFLVNQQAKLGRGRPAGRV